MTRPANPYNVRGLTDTQHGNVPTVEFCKQLLETFPDGYISKTLLYLRIADPALEVLPSA